MIFGAVTIFGIASWWFMPEEKWLRREQVLQGLAATHDSLRTDEGELSVSEDAGAVDRKSL